MNPQMLLTIAAVVGPLVGVALGAFLAGRFQERHWFRDRRLDAFVAAQAAIYNILLWAPIAVEAVEPADKATTYTTLNEAVGNWQEARGRLAILASKSVVSLADTLHEALKVIGLAATEGDKTDWEQRMEACKTQRASLVAEMRKELKTP